MVEATEKKESGGQKASAAPSDDVMLPELQPDSTSQPIVDREALAKKEEEIAKAEQAELEAAKKAAAEDDEEGPLGHMVRGSDR